MKNYLERKRTYYDRNREEIIAKQCARQKRQLLEKQIALAGRPPPKNCECCDKPTKRLVFDHEHTPSKRFRGWICGTCNLALGYIHDNPNEAIMLARYLHHFGGHNIGDKYPQIGAT